jgi:hypothetical protein
MPENNMIPDGHLAIIWFGYRRARNERQLLIDFLRSTISADQRAAPNITASLTS